MPEEADMLSIRGKGSHSSSGSREMPVNAQKTVFVGLESHLSRYGYRWPKNIWIIQLRSTNRHFRRCQALQLAVVFPAVRAALSSAHGQPRTQTTGNAHGACAQLPSLRRDHIGDAVSLLLRPRYLRPLRRGESGYTCQPCADPRHLRPLITAGGCSVQAMDLNLARPLGPRVLVTSPETLRRLLIYLGALPVALREFDRSRPSHGKGNVRITLEPGRKNLLRLRL
jgi:hypothetical protein